MMRNITVQNVMADLKNGLTFQINPSQMILFPYLLIQS